MGNRIWSWQEVFHDLKIQHPLRLQSYQDGTWGDDLVLALRFCSEKPYLTEPRGMVFSKKFFQGERGCLWQTRRSQGNWQVQISDGFSAMCFSAFGAFLRVLRTWCQTFWGRNSFKICQNVRRGFHEYITRYQWYIKWYIRYINGLSRLWRNILPSLNW